MARVLTTLVMAGLLLAFGLYVMHMRVKDLSSGNRYDYEKEVSELTGLEPMEDPKPERDPEPEILPVPIQRTRLPDTARADVDLSGESVPKDPARLDQWKRQMGLKCKALYREKEFDPARYCFHVLLAQNQNNADAVLGLGILAARTGEPEEAYHRYQQFLELAPKDPRAIKVRRFVGQYDKYLAGETPPAYAEEENTPIRKAVNLYKHAFVLRKTDPGEALRMLEQAKNEMPEEAGYLLERIEILIGEIQASGSDRSRPTLTTLNQGQIEAVVEEYKYAIINCAKQQRKRTPAFSSTQSEVAFVIGPEGKVDKFRVLAKEQKGTYLEECLTFVIGTMKFPRFSGKPVPVEALSLSLVEDP